VEFGWTNNLVYFIGLIPALAIFIFTTSISKLLGLSIQPPKIQLKKADDLPAYLKKLYADAVTQLTPLGFKIQHCQASKPVITADNSIHWSLVLTHPDSGVIAEISPATTFLDMPGYEVNFWSFAPDGTTLLTANGRGYTILTEIPGVTVHDPNVLSLHQQYDTHLEERREWCSSTNYQLPNPVDYCKLQLKLMAGYLDNLKQEGSIKSTGETSYRLSLLKCIKLLPDYSKGVRQAKKLLAARFKSKLKNKLTGTATKAQSSSEYPVETDLMAHIKMRNANQREVSGVFAKVLLVIATLLITYVGLGITVSLHSLLIISGVFLLHELGHLLAMIVFRYRDPQILCVPLLGLAKNDKSRPVANWQQVVIHMMGPLPGIIGSFALLFLNKYSPTPWVYEAAIIMLLINYLHLLPYMSLDGGRIMRLTVMERFPIGKILFPLFSAAIFAAGGYYLGEPAFWALSMLIVASIPFGMREMAILRLINKQLKDLANKNQNIKDIHSLDETNKLARVFHALKHKKFRKLNFVKKFTLVKSLEGLLRQPSHSSNIIAFTFVGIYLGILVLPPAAIFLTDVSNFQEQKFNLAHRGKTVINDEQAKLDRAKTHKERFNLLVSFARNEMKNENFPKALDYLEQAESTYGNINSDESLAILFENYSQYYNLTKALDDSYVYLDKAIGLRKKSQKIDNHQLAVNYSTLSNILFKQQKNTESEHYLKKALSYSLKINDLRDCEIITKISGQLLDWYYTEDRPEEAQQLLQALVKKFENRETPIKNYINKFVYEEHGWLNAAKNNEKAALENFDQALELAEQTATQLNAKNPDRREEAKLLLYKAAVYYKEGYNDFSKIQFNNAEEIVKENSFESIKQYIDEYTSATLPITTNKNNVRREAKRWQLINDAYSRTHS
jgi:tetratricopeptide (TPR) repeat protein